MDLLGHLTLLRPRVFITPIGDADKKTLFNRAGIVYFEQSVGTLFTNPKHRRFPPRLAVSRRSPPLSFGIWCRFHSLSRNEATLSGNSFPVIYLWKLGAFVEALANLRVF